MIKLESQPYHRVIACPSKMYIMDQLHKGKMDIEDIVNDSNVFRPSVKRHIQELLKDNLVIKHDNGKFLIITDAGVKVVRYIEGGKESLRTVYNQ